MKLYLAAAFSRREEIWIVARELRFLGFDVTSRWLENTPAVLKNRREKMQDAFMDVNDLREADILVRFTDDFQGQEYIPAKLGSGARMFEFGMAWERGMPVIVVGGIQNVFDNLPNIRHVKDVEELKKHLGAYL
jgi:nucleoside 2-deoxyribosyltransferase